jgi:hypothetical protein
VSKLLRIGLSVLLLALSVAASAAPAAPSFPVKYSADHRYLVDQDDVPFPILGRTAWFVLSLHREDYRKFLDDTAARGYTAIELHVINHDPRGNNPPYNGDGDLPFLKRLDGKTWNGALSYADIESEAPDLTIPNESYWTYVDDFLAVCEDKGMLVLLFPAYVGARGSDQGWMRELVANGPVKVRSFGAWIATRYKERKNIVWMMGGDMGTPPDAFVAAQSAVEEALLAGLASVPGQQSTLLSAEWASQSIATDQATLGHAMTLNGAYSWTGDVNTQGRRAYARIPAVPAFLLEGPYDEEGLDGNRNNSNAIQPVRRFQWWGWLSTIGGYVSGNGYVWPFRPAAWFQLRGWLRSIKSAILGGDHVWPFRTAWSDHLDTQGARDMTRLNMFIRSIAWYKLVPSGFGTPGDLIVGGASPPESRTYVAAAASPDGTLMVAYVPPAHRGPITVAMAAMSGATRARWFDPTSGSFRDIAAGLPNSGSRSFTPPGLNSGGDSDWVLLLESPG